MSLVDGGTYYIENHFSEKSIARKGASSSGLIEAKQYNDANDQNFSINAGTTAGTYNIQNKNDSTYLAPASAVIGAKVISQSAAYNWTIAPVGDGYYSITTPATNTDNGQLAVQVVSTDNNVPVYVGSYVGASTQRWQFTSES